MTLEVSQVCTGGDNPCGLSCSIVLPSFQQPSNNLPTTFQQPSNNLPTTLQQPYNNLPTTFQQPSNNLPTTSQQHHNNITTTSQQHHNNITTTFQPSNLPTFQPSNLPSFHPPSPFMQSTESASCMSEPQQVEQSVCVVRNATFCIPQLPKTNQNSDCQKQCCLKFARLLQCALHSKSLHRRLLVRLNFEMACLSWIK
jgi:hypothetical protein